MAAEKLMEYWKQSCLPCSTPMLWRGLTKCVRNGLQLVVELQSMLRIWDSLRNKIAHRAWKSPDDLCGKEVKGFVFQNYLFLSVITWKKQYYVVFVLSPLGRFVNQVLVGYSPGGHRRQKRGERGSGVGRWTEDQNLHNIILYNVTSTIFRSR